MRFGFDQAKDKAAAEGAAQKLVRERDDLLREREELVRDSKQLQEKLRRFNELVEEHNALREERQHLADRVVKLEQLLPERERLMGERTELTARIGELERQLEAYRAERQRPNKLLLYATKYAESVRESARQDAELTLRKARARAQTFLHESESERRRIEQEIVRLERLATDTRQRLSSFTRAVVEMLETEVGTTKDADVSRASDDLQRTLQAGLASVRRPQPPMRPRPDGGPEAPVAASAAADDSLPVDE